MAAPAPRPDKSIGAAGSCAGYRRLLAYEVLETFSGEVLGCGVALRSLFWLFIPHVFLKIERLAIRFTDRIQAPGRPPWYRRRKPLVEIPPR